MEEEEQVSVSFITKKCDIESGDTSSHVKVQSSTEKWKQFGAALSVCWLCISSGQTLGYTSTAIPSMLEDWANFGQGTSGLTPEQISWIGGLTPLGALCGSITATLPIRRYSTKYTILFFATPIFFLSNLIIAFSSKSITMIFVGRFLGGLGIGLVISSCPLYVIEIASDQYRGCLGILPQFLLILGIWLSNVIGTFLDWRLLSLALFIMTLPSIPLLLFAPNPPAYYIARRKLEKAILSHQRLHGAIIVKSQNPLNSSDSELTSPKKEQHQKAIKDTATVHLMTELEKSVSGTEVIGGRRLGSKFDIPTIKACAVALGLMSFQQLSGINAIAFFSVTIFKQSEMHDPRSSKLHPYLAACFLISVQLIAVFISTCLVERLGRKVLLLISSSLLSVSCGGLAVYYYFCAGHPDKNVEGNAEGETCTNLFWLPLTLLVSYMFAFAVGYGPLCWIILTEILPGQVRNFMNPLAIGYSWFCVFLVTTSFPLLIIRIQLFGIFCLYGGIGVMGVIFILICVPETKGKTLLQVQAFFGKGRL